MFDFSRFSLSNMVECGSILRKQGDTGSSLEEVAGRIVAQFDRWFRIPETGEPACVLVRLFKTHPFRQLPEELQRITAAQMAPEIPTAETRCLTLMATTGILAEWNETTRSKRHRVIALPCVEALSRFPMIAQLVRQLGLKADDIVGPPHPIPVDLDRHSFEVFHVADAVGNSVIPDQADFVIPHGVRSVLGFGGILPGGDFYSLILFSRVPIPRATAELFKPLALCVKLSLLPFLGDRDFAGRPSESLPVTGSVGNEEAQRSRIAALEQLVEVAEPIILSQSTQLEETLAESRNLMESAADAILVADGRGIIIRVNQEAERMFGYHREELEGHPVEILIPKYLHTRHLENRKRYAETSPQKRPKLFNLSVATLHRDGREIPTELTLSPLETRQGLLVIVILRDVTERRRAEEHLRKQNLLLEEIARSERAAHEARKQLESRLIQSEKLAALGRMVAGVAHEVNNPLAFVRNNLAILQRDLCHLRDLIQLYQEADGSLVQSRPELLARIRALADDMDLAYTLSNVEGLAIRSNAGLKRIEQIVLDLRDFARLHEADLQEIDLNQGIEATLAIARMFGKERNIQITTDFGAIGRITCYPAKLNQVVLNLLTNAIDASPEGSAVGLQTRPAADGGVALAVIDQGNGIDPSIHDKIFEPFFTTKPVGQGTGLGLSIAYGIVELHGGRLDFETSPSRGTRFNVYLPSSPPRQPLNNRENLHGVFLGG